MKASIFNILIENQKYKNWLIYNSLRNSLLEIDESTKQYLEKAESLPVKEPEGCENIKSEDKDILIEYGFIVDENCDELKEAIRIDDEAHNYIWSSKFMSLTICPTYDCNLQCPYCYEVYNRDSLSYGIMGDDVQNNIIQLYAEHCQINTGLDDPNSNTDSITWYGGEPLLNTGIIGYVQDKINSLAVKYKRNIKRTIITNGILLNKENQKMLKENGIQHVQITVDGPGIIHNKRRYFPEAPDKSFEIIMNNIRNIDDYFIISMRINTDKENSPYLDKLLEELIKWNVWPNKRMNISIANVQCDWNKDSKISLKINDFEKIQRDFRMNQVRRFNEMSNNKKAKLKLDYPSTNKLGSVCGFVNHKNSFAIGPQGELYTCWKSVGNKKYRIGNVKDLLNNNKISNEGKQRFHSHFREEIKCYSCKIFPICSLSCPSLYLQTGEIYREQLCSKWKYMLKDTLLFNYDCQNKSPDLKETNDNCI